MLSSDFDCSANFLGSNDKAQNTSEKNLNKLTLFFVTFLLDRTEKKT